MEFLTKLFYFMGWIPLTIELITFMEPQRVYNLHRKLKNINREQISAPIILWVFSGWFYYFWTIIGIFSSQRWIFLMILMVSIIVGKIRKKWDTVSIQTIDALICITLILTIILNKYA